MSAKAVRAHAEAGPSILRRALSRVAPSLRIVARADGGVDIVPPNRLANLCIRKVRANAASSGQASDGVDISRRHRLAALWISTVSVAIRSNRGPIEVWTSGLRRDSKPCASEW